MLHNLVNSFPTLKHDFLILLLLSWHNDASLTLTLLRDLKDIWTPYVATSIYTL